MHGREYFRQKKAEGGHYNFVLQSQSAEENRNFVHICKAKAILLRRYPEHALEMVVAAAEVVMHWEIFFR
jgi:hypothetical protein